MDRCGSLINVLNLRKNTIQKIGNDVAKKSRQVLVTDIRKSCNIHNEKSDLVFSRVQDSCHFQLDMTRIQIWTFDENMKVVSGIIDPLIYDHPIEYYIGRSIYNFLNDDNFMIWESIVNTSLKGEKTCHTFNIKNQLCYIETKTVFHCKETNEIHGCVLIIIPYKSNYSVK